MKVMMVMALIAITLFAFGGAAFAADGPTPPKLGDPIGADVSPHGGFSSTTDYCLQCHTVHGAPDPAYALMARPSTTDVCATCHQYGPITGSPTGAINPGLDPQVEGTASQRGVYTSNAVHIIGANGPTIYASNWNYGWTFNGPAPQGPSTTTPPPAGTASATAGGLYCASCHTAHGDFGQLINSKWAVTSASGSLQVSPWAEGTAIYWDNPNDGIPENYVVMYLHKGPASWEVCTATGGGGTCYYAQVLDAEGQLVSLYGYKLLTSSPNHQYPTSPTAPAGTGLYSNRGQCIGTLVGAITASSSSFQVNETGAPSCVSPSTGRSGTAIQIGTEYLRISGIVRTTQPATYTVATGGRGIGGTTAAAHAASDAVTTLGTQRAAVRSWSTDIYNHDSALFCGTCHSSVIDWSFGGTNHNHPTGCTACHGNPADGSSSDWPHSSTSPFLLKEDPDALCIECHVAGSLP